MPPLTHTSLPPRDRECSRRAEVTQPVYPYAQQLSSPDDSIGGGKHPSALRDRLG